MLEHPHGRDHLSTIWCSLGHFTVLTSHLPLQNNLANISLMLLFPSCKTPLSPPSLQDTYLHLFTYRHTLPPPKQTECFKLQIVESEAL